MGGKSSAPAAPDYASAATATAAGNLDAARYATQANRATQNTPYGTLSWSQGTNADGTDNNHWTQNVSLNETGQQLLDASNRTSLNLAGLQDQASSRVAAQQNAGWNDAATPAAGQALNYTPQNLNAGTSDRVNVADNIDYYDAAKSGKVGDVYNPQQDTNSATQAIMARVNPQLQQQRAAEETQLANQGITRGSEAWNNAQTTMGQRENDAYSQAGLQGINLGLSQQGQTYGQEMGNRSALSQDQVILGGQQMGVRQQNIGQAEANQQASLQDAQRNLTAQQASAQLNLQGQNQAFNQANTAHAGALQDQSYYANRDMNQLNALRTGSQVTAPSFGSYAQQQTTAGPDLLGAATQTYNGQVAQTNANNANSAGMFGGALSLANTGMAGAYMFSDERLKKDIKRVGELSNGIGIYVFTYIGEEQPQLGCIAQDVAKIMPDAVMQMTNGYYAVNYAEVLK
jgi:hypothetical protein